MGLDFPLEGPCPDGHCGVTPSRLVGPGWAGDREGWLLWGWNQRSCLQPLGSDLLWVTLGAPRCVRQP